MIYNLCNIIAYLKINRKLQLSLNANILHRNCHKTQIESESFASSQRRVRGVWLVADQKLNWVQQWERERERERGGGGGKEGRGDCHHIIERTGDNFRIKRQEKKQNHIFIWEDHHKISWWIYKKCMTRRCDVISIWSHWLVRDDCGQSPHLIPSISCSSWQRTNLVIDFSPSSP